MSTKSSVVSEGFVHIDSYSEVHKALQSINIGHQLFKDSEEREGTVLRSLGNERSECLIILYVVKVETLEVPSEAYQMVSESHNTFRRRRSIYGLNPKEGNERC